jgi:ligand-binding sensor domain-containing protein/two-component sensor histidine kinase
MIPLRISLLVILVCVARMLDAQDKAMKFSHITVQDGLPGNTVNSIFLDHKGLIWAATENGVGRYDAYSFRTYRSSERDSMWISSNVTYVVFEDSHKRLWVGTEKGLDLYNRRLDKFDRHFFSGVPVRAVFQDNEGNLWIGSDIGLYRYDERDKSFRKELQVLFDRANAIYNTIPAIAQDHQGRLWIGTSRGVYSYDKRVRSIVHYNDTSTVQLSNNNVRSILCDRRGNVWIATYGGGLNMFDIGSNTLTQYRWKRGSSNGISTDLLTSLWEDPSGKIWIGTDAKGIDILNPATGVFEHVTHSAYNAQSLNNNVIRTITSDRRGAVWIGTYNGGINFYNQNADAFFHYNVPTVNGNSSITCFAEEPDGNLWIGTDGGGLCFFNRTTGEFFNFFHKEDDANSLSDNRIISLLRDDDGSLWIGTYLGGLNRFDPRSRRFSRWREHDNSGLTDDVIWVLLKDGSQRILAGTNNGLNILNKSTMTFSSRSISNSALSNNMIRALHHDKNGDIWIGTQDGLNVLRKKTDEIEVVHNNSSTKTALSNYWIRTIAQDGHGDLWIGTFSGGLNHYDRHTKSFTAFTEIDGLPDNNVSGIIPDVDNTIWLSTHRGLARLDGKTKVIKSYSFKDGLQDTQFNINSCFRTSRGEFIFGSNNGFTLFKPEEIIQAQENPFPPSIVFTSVSVFNKEIERQTKGYPISTSIDEAENVELEYDQSMITFEFAALNYIHPEKNEYAYRLKGFENEWNFIGTKRTATYTNVQPGSYTFEVKAANNDGVWSDPKGIGVIIHPPFWQTYWFKAIVLAIVSFIVFFIVNRIRQRIREKIRVNKLIAELEIKALIAQMNPHFIFNSLTSIQELIMINKQQEAMHYLNQFSRLLRTVLECSEKNMITLEQEITLLRLYLELESMRFDNKFHYEISLDNAIDPEEVVIPSFLLQPFVENALWHGLMHKEDDRRLRISFALVNNETMTCTIADNGIGRARAAEIRKKRVRSYQSLGLKIMKDRVEQMKKQNNCIDLRIIDEINASGEATGTTVILQLPVEMPLEEISVTV